MSLSYKQNRERMIEDGFNVSEYEGGKSNYTNTYTRRWQHVTVFKHLKSIAGAAYHGTHTLI